MAQVDESGVNEMEIVVKADPGGIRYVAGKLCLPVRLVADRAEFARVVAETLADCAPAVANMLYRAPGRKVDQLDMREVELHLSATD